jgi:thymidylate kinase
MAGDLVVVEGVNGVGKTTLIRKILPALDDEWVYCKGFTSDSAWDRFISGHPHSFTYYLDLALKTKNKIRPALEEGMHVIHDRYVQTVDSFLPDADFLHNRMLRQVMDSFFIIPRLYIYVTASVDEVVSRLSKNAPDAYRIGLVNHPELIEMRMERYDAIFDGLDCQKYRLETDHRSVDDCADELIGTIRRDIRCS